MKLRMYLRGFGLGIVMTALVMSFGVKTQNSTMTDAQVRQRALELGMVDESTTLTAPTTVKEETDIEPVAQENSENEMDETENAIDADDAEDEAIEPEPEVVEESSETEEAISELEGDSDTDNSSEDIVESEQEAEESAGGENETKEPEVETTATSSSLKDYTLSVQKGYSSDRVAKILEDAGVIDNSTSFDKYLCSNGYDKKISVGTYNIPAGADYEAIARIITRSN